MFPLIKRYGDDIRSIIWAPTDASKAIDHEAVTRLTVEVVETIRSAGEAAFPDDQDLRNRFLFAALLGSELPIEDIPATGSTSTESPDPDV